MKRRVRGMGGKWEKEVPWKREVKKEKEQTRE
jgi:hypothetical protein